MVIDTHCHVFEYPTHWSKEMADIYINAIGKLPLWWDPSRTWKHENLHVDADWLVADMDEGGVDKAFVMGHVWRPYRCETPVEWVASVIARYPDRLIGFHVADPLGGLEAVRQLERAVRDLGFRGLKLFPAYNHISLDDERLYPLFEKAQELGIPALVHTGYTHVPTPTIASQNPLLLEKVALTFPRLKLIMGHTGFHWSHEAIMLMDKFGNLYGDFAYWAGMPIDYIARTFAFAKAKGVMGRLLWGTDFPHWGHAEDKERYFRVAEYMRKHEIEPCVTDDDIDNFLGNSAAKLMGFA